MKTYELRRGADLLLAIAESVAAVLEDKAAELGIDSDVCSSGRRDKTTFNLEKTNEYKNGRTSEEDQTSSQLR